MLKQTKKLNSLRKTIERFKADQNNLELWEALRLNKTVADDCGEAYTILMETCIVKMQEELEAWTDKEKVSPMVSKKSPSRTRSRSTRRTRMSWMKVTLSLLEVFMRDKAPG